MNLFTTQLRKINLVCNSYSQIQKQSYLPLLNQLCYSTSSTNTEEKPKLSFRLTKSFVEKHKEKKPEFGFGILGELVYMRTYSRVKEDKTNEKWYETVERVVNGCYNMQKRWIEEHELGWNAWQAQKSAQEMYSRIFEMKFLPPGRGLWAMGSPLTESKGLYAALNNCAFVSTDNLKDEPSKPFVFLMDASMLGVGVGFDTKGAGSIVIKGPNLKNTTNIVIDDTREGWVESVKLLLDSHFEGTNPVTFDYTKIRKAGEEIKGFGGKSAGPEILEKLHNELDLILKKGVGNPITVTTIVDIMNLIGKCVVSGNTRQTAEIAFGDPNLEEYIDLKNYKKNPHRAEYGWTSNNSVFANLGMDYSDVADRVRDNGEPGFAWLQNMQQFSRMNDQNGDNKDHRAAGGNPCLEQTLESYELCCLVETFPNNHNSLEDFKRTLKFAYLYAKTVTLGKTSWAGTNRVMLRNRRIGCSMSGIAQFITEKGLHTLKEFCEEGYQTIQTYDKIYSDWLAIPRSIKTTSIKPSGTVSLLAGATPGLHYPISQYYIRRIRMSEDSPLLQPLRESGYEVQPCVDSPGTSVVEIPINAGKNIRKASDVSMWEQLSLAAFLQKYWADNQVSCTVTFDPKTEGPQLESALAYFQYQLKGVSFLPLVNHNFPQMPYEEINEEKYNELISKINTNSNLSKINKHSVPTPEKFCDASSCEI